MTFRVVSLVPSVTETLSAWDITPVACTRFCERPDLRHVGGTKNPDIDAIVALRPDLVIVDAEENRIEDHDALVAEGVDVHALRIRSVEDVNAQMAVLAERLGAGWVPVEHERPATSVVVFVPIWRRPWMALGAPTYGTSLLASIGVGNVFADRGRYPEVELEDAASRSPAMVVAPSEPYPFGERHRRELSSVGRMVLVDGRDLFWWGTRTLGAMDRLRRAIGV